MVPPVPLLSSRPKFHYSETNISLSRSPSSFQEMGNPKASLLIRRKSALPQDFETATALHQYQTKDKILPAADET